MKTPDLKNCTLHSIPFEYFCERCLEPVCRQCTITGPHNTQVPILSFSFTPYQPSLQPMNVA